MAIDAAGNVNVTGGSGGSGIYDSDYATVKFGPDGAQLWEARYNGPANGNEGDTAYALTLDEVVTFM